MATGTAPLLPPTKFTLAPRCRQQAATRRQARRAKHQRTSQPPSDHRRARKGGGTQRVGAYSTAAEARLRGGGKRDGGGRPGGGPDPRPDPRRRARANISSRLALASARRSAGVIARWGIVRSARATPPLLSPRLPHQQQGRRLLAGCCHLAAESAA
jgi:hypothetical protein